MLKGTDPENIAEIYQVASSVRPLKHSATLRKEKNGRKSMHLSQQKPSVRQSFDMNEMLDILGEDRRNFEAA